MDFILGFKRAIKQARCLGQKISPDQYDGFLSQLAVTLVVITVALFAANMTRDQRDQRDQREVRRSKGRGTSPHLSKYYIERFGNQSPDHYNNLRISAFDQDLSNDEVKDILEKEFRELDRFEIKMVRQGNQDRFAYVNFDVSGIAKQVRRNKIDSLQRKLGRHICLDPTGVLRDQEGKYIPDRYNRSLMDRRDVRERERERSPPERRRPSPPPHRQRDVSPIFKLNNEQPTRTLFVGNLPADVRESEVREVFEKYGKVEDVDLKFVAGGEASYAFVLYCSINDAEKANERQHNKPFRKGTTKFRCQIGYGKAQVSRKLWVGDLGSWASSDMLMKEFDRYGPIEDIDYERGRSYAYITFNDIQAATDACKAMRGNTLDRDHKIAVDFAKVHKGERVRKRGRSPSPEPIKRRRRSPAPIDGRSSASSHSSRSERNHKIEVVDDQIDNIDKLRDIAAATWKGHISLKKLEYPISLHRIHGKEHVIQEYLRDDDGLPVKLVLSQRLALDDSLYDKLLSFTADDTAYCIGVERDRSISGLTNYLEDKNAAGVITHENVITYILGHSATATRVLSHIAPRFTNILQLNPGTVLIIAKKN